MIKLVKVGSYFQENTKSVELTTKHGVFNIVESDGGIKVHLVAEDGNDRICVSPKSSNMVVLTKFKDN